MNKLPVLVLALLIHHLLAESLDENTVCRTALAKYETELNDKTIDIQCQAIPALVDVFRKNNCKMGEGIFAYVNFCKIDYNE